MVDLSLGMGMSLNEERIMSSAMANHANELVHAGGVTHRAEPDAASLNDLVQRILTIVTPFRIILFGSAARGEMGPNSDLDLLVVVPDGTDCRKTAMRLYRDIHGVRTAFDLLVATPALLSKHAHTLGLVYRRALKEGRELYVA